MTVHPLPKSSTPRHEATDYFAVVDHALCGSIPNGGHCAESRQDPALQAVFDGDSDDPSVISRARAICRSCPALIACRRYADESGDQHTFLAGMTAGEREENGRRSHVIARRRWNVRLLHAAGATVTEMLEVLEVSRRTIEADIEALGLNGSRRRSAS